MANHKSAIKRIRQSRKRRLYNRENKDVMKKSIKAVRQASSYEEAMEKLRVAYKVLDKIASRGILHKNTVANKKSRLSKHALTLKETT